MLGTLVAPVPEDGVCTHTFIWGVPAAPWDWAVARAKVCEPHGLKVSWDHSTHKGRSRGMGKRSI